MRSKYNHVDLIIINGNILTMDANNSVSRAVAVDQGIIVAVGDINDVLEFKSDSTLVIDLDGKTMIPGFIDAHTHLDLFSTMTSEYVVDCHIPPLKNVEDIIGKIKEFVDRKPEGELIIGQGRLDQAYPTREQLDRVAPRHPVLLKSTMHHYYLNSCALQNFNINRYNPSLEELMSTDPGSYIERDPVTGEPTGFAFDCWSYMFPGSRSPFSHEENYQAIKAGMDLMTSYGITSIVDFSSYRESGRIYRQLFDDGELKIRLQLVPCFYGLHKTVDIDEIINSGLTSGFGNEWIKFGGLKILTDIDNKTICSEVQLNYWFRKAHHAGIRMFMHAMTRASQDMVLGAIEQEAKKGKEAAARVNNMRHRVEHLGNEGHDLAHLERLKKVGAIGMPTAYFLNVGELNLMSADTDKKFMFKTMLDMGLCVPGNSDGGGSIPECHNPFYEIWCMVNRKTIDGEVFLPDEKITPYEALQIYTIHAAYAGKEEKIKGTIEAGKLADFAILSDNPLTVPEDDLRHINVNMTIVNGKVVYDNNLC